MLSKSKQQTALADKGRALAAWLNRSETLDNQVAWHIKFCVSVGDIANRTSAPENFIGAAFTTGALGWLPVKLRAEFTPSARSIQFNLVPNDEDSRWLYVFGELCDSGNMSRLKLCPRCMNIWYCAGRTDKRFCTLPCKVAYWQKTPAGRKAKREYMREYRATERRLWEAKQKGRTLKRGRKLHVSLKRGE